MGNGFFDCMIVTNGRHTCRASDLYTKKDTFSKRPQSWHDLSLEEKERTKDKICNEDNNIES